MSRITPEMQSALQESFNSLAKKGVVPYKYIPQLFRLIGFKLSRRELSDVLQQLVLDKDRNLEFLDFLAYVSFVTDARCSKDELLEAFRGLDRDGTGRLQVNDLRTIYTQGRKDLENQFDQLVKSLCVINGELDYEDFVSKRFAL